MAVFLLQPHLLYKVLPLWCVGWCSEIAHRLDRESWGRVLQATSCSDKLDVGGVLLEDGRFHVAADCVLQIAYHQHLIQEYQNTGFSAYF